MAVKSAGKVVLISSMEVRVKVGLDMARGVLGGMIVTGLTRDRTCVETFGIVAASRVFSGFRSGTMLSRS